MPKPDSIRLKKEALQCETAAKLADFLENYAPYRSYDFVLPDLLSFKCEETLLGLREIPTWQTLEHEFRAVGGWLSEDWDDVADEYIPPHTDKPRTEKRTPKNDATGLIIVILAVSALIGGWVGWNYPYFRFPILSQQVTTPNK